MRLPSASMTELELSTPAEAVPLPITMASTAIPATAARRVKDLYPGRAVLMFVMPIPIQYVLQPIRKSMQSVTIRAPRRLRVVQKFTSVSRNPPPLTWYSVARWAGRGRSTAASAERVGRSGTGSSTTEAPENVHPDFPVAFSPTLLGDAYAEGVSRQPMSTHQDATPRPRLADVGAEPTPAARRGPVCRDVAADQCLRVGSEPNTEPVR